MSDKNGIFDYRIGKNKTRAGVINSSTGGTISYRSKIDGKTRVFKIPKFSSLNEEGSVTSITGKGRATGTASNSESGGGMIPGLIESGTGDTYQVKLFPTNLSEFTTTVEVKQLQIDENETIPIDTWVTVSKHGDGYIMQVPVWLEGEEEEEEIA